MKLVEDVAEMQYAKLDRFSHECRLSHICFLFRFKILLFV